MKYLLTLLFASALTTSSLMADDLDHGIFGYMTDEVGLTLQVPSSGCTKKEDFKVHQMESFPLQLRFERVEMDRCRAIVPYGTKIQWTWKELGLTNFEEFTVANNLKVLQAH